jgi:hypothetical protein
MLPSGGYVKVPVGQEGSGSANDRKAIHRRRHRKLIDLAVAEHETYCPGWAGRVEGGIDRESGISRVTSLDPHHEAIGTTRHEKAFGTIVPEERFTE